jgi:RNA polymerase sigma-70 factor (ECF subfamily)
MRELAVAAENVLSGILMPGTEALRGRSEGLSQHRCVTFTPIADNVAVGERTITFHDLYERYAADVYRFAHWLTGNPEDARDITSDTFARAWTAEADPNSETVKAYLFTIARNLHRKQWRRTSRFEPFPDDMLDPAAQPDAAAADKEELGRTMVAIQGLPELDRTVLLLRAQDGMSYEEIAGITGISATAAKVRVFRARTRLAAQLQAKI